MDETDKDLLAFGLILLLIVIIGNLLSFAILFGVMRLFS